MQVTNITPAAETAITLIPAQRVTAADVMEKISYSFSLHQETIEVAGVSVEIWNDHGGSNPYDNDEFMAPAIWFYEDYREYGDANLENFFRNVSPAWVSRNWKKIAEIIEVCDLECRKRSRDYGIHLSEVRHEHCAEQLQEMRWASFRGAEEYLEILEKLYRLRGCAAKTFVSRGCSQGDVSIGLIVHTPEWVKKSGFSGDSEERMSADFSVFNSWAWGDVYGYTVDGDASCGGYYGHDVEYFAETVADEINHVLESRIEEMAPIYH